MADTLLFQWSERKPLQVAVRVSSMAKYMRLKVLPTGHVEVVVPPHFDRRRVPAFVEQNRVWVEQQLGRVHREHLLDPVIQPQRIDLPAIDGYWDVQYGAAPPGRSQCRERADGSLLVNAGGAEWRDALSRWLMRTARVHLVPWLERVSAETDLPFKGVSVRGQKTRWGSCSTRKTINLNYRLLFLPPPVVRYLFVHELSHTVHMNHSQRFWGLVARKEPNFKALDAELRHAGKMIPRWARAE